MFDNREEAAQKLAQRFEGRQFKDPLVLAIPRGGIIAGAALAKALDGELDIILSRKLRSPDNPAVLIGAVCEDRRFVVTNNLDQVSGLSETYLAEETRRESREIERLKAEFRKGLPALPMRGRSVIVTDDGIETGASMIAALQAIRVNEPFEIIVAIPVATKSQVDQLRLWCDEVVSLSQAPTIQQVRKLYRDFPEISATCISDWLRESRHVVESSPMVRRHGPVCPPIGVMTEKDWSE